MKRFWSIRMRASKRIQNSKFKIQNSGEIHISGAEGLYEDSDIQRIIRSYIDRALSHPKGKPSVIRLAVEEVSQKPVEISTLDVSTVYSGTPSSGRKISARLLHAVGVSEEAISNAFEIIQKGRMRGAAILTSERGRRLELDTARGVRVSRLGISKKGSRALSMKLSRHGINTDTVKEALILASKVSHCEGTVAELCISDDPNYTTGYVASRVFGYVRIPNFKRAGSKIGGRVFFVKEGINIDNMNRYLEKVPVLVESAGSCRGIRSADEILDSSHQ
ncbi:MAG: 6-carboxyhexanoate--CoA ligase [Nitrospirota bacterium]